jgi:hypothetical protein
MSESGAALALKLLEEPELELANPTKAETLDLIIACALSEYEPGNLYLLALNGRRIAARFGSTVEMMRWSLAAKHARAQLAADAAARLPEAEWL